MKYVLFILITIVTLACNRNNSNSAKGNINSTIVTANLSNAEKPVYDSLISDTKVDSSGVFVWVDSVQHLNPMIDGEQVATTFTFKNGGNAPLAIKSVNGSCGCTEAKTDKFLYKPGETGTIYIKFNSAGKATDDQAPLRKTVDVYANTKNRIQAAVFDVIVKKK
jgi:hypothetical protein